MSTFQPHYIHFELIEPYQSKTCFYILCSSFQLAEHVEKYLTSKYKYLIRDEQNGVISQTVPATDYTQITWENFVRMADNRLDPLG